MHILTHFYVVSLESVAASLPSARPCAPDLAPVRQSFQFFRPIPSANKKNQLIN